MYIYIYLNIYIYIHIHYITLHYITWYDITSQYIALHYTTLHYITSHHITSHYITLHTYIHTYSLFTFGTRWCFPLHLLHWPGWPGCQRPNLARSCCHSVYGFTFFHTFSAVNYTNYVKCFGHIWAMCIHIPELC